MDGGFLVQLEFMRHPTFRFTAHLDIYVPVNQIINIGDFYLIDRSLSSRSQSRPALNDGAVVGIGGVLPNSPVFGDLWAVGLLPSKTSSISQTCTPGVHDISALDGPLIEPNDQLKDDVVTCLDRKELICVTGGVLSHRIGLKVRHLTLVSLKLFGEMVINLSTVM